MILVCVSSRFLVVQVLVTQTLFYFCAYLSFCTNIITERSNPHWDTWIIKMITNTLDTQTMVSYIN